MYSLRDTVTFAIDEFRRGLEGVTPEEAVWRALKTDGSQMNAISWTVQHIGAHWHTAALMLQGQPPQSHWPPRDGTPPAYLDAMAILEAGAELLTTAVEQDSPHLASPARERASETVAQYLARAVFHTWFHAGEINAVRQLLGHDEIRYVGPIGDRFHIAD